MFSESWFFTLGVQLLSCCCKYVISNYTTCFYIIVFIWTDLPWNYFTVKSAKPKEQGIEEGDIFILFQQLDLIQDIRR